MPFPAGLPLVEVVCAFDALPDGAAAGRVRFETVLPLMGPTANSIVPPISETVELDDTGSGTIELPATNDPAWTPVDQPYAVTCSVQGAVFRGTLLLDFEETSVNLADRLQLDGAAEPGVTYVTLAQFNAALAGKAPLVHQHEIADVDDLQTQLDGKLAVPVEPYITADDIANLVSYETLQEELNDYLPKAGPVVTDSTLTVVRTAGGAARWRSTGGALDIDVVGDVIESRFANQDFSGTQTGLRRLRADGNTLAGVTEFGSTPYTSEQAIDGATGVARLGAKNTAINLRLAGYLDIATAPTTGTWAVGDVVFTQLGPMRCTVAGTPGTWRPLGSFPALAAGYSGWNGEPGLTVQAGTIIATGGRSHIIRFRALDALITTLHMHATTAAAGVTNAWCTLHDDNGLILNANAKSNANQNVAFQTGGMKTFTLLAGQAVTPGAYYRARVWFTTSGALPTLSRMCNSGADIINPGVTGTAASTPYGWATADTGLTDLASAPDQIGSLTGNGTAYWIGARP